MYKGTGLLASQPLNDIPSALCVFNADEGTECIPTVAVAAGPSIYIYRNMRWTQTHSKAIYRRCSDSLSVRYRPFHKFNLPSRPITEREKELWATSDWSNDEAFDAVERVTHLAQALIELRGAGAVQKYIHLDCD